MYDIDEITNTILHGNALTELKNIPDNCIDMICTSPPYYALRSYIADDVIWDGDINCNHEWEIISTRRPNSQGGKSEMLKRKNVENFQAYTDYNKRKVESKKCIKCNAWCGQLGQEPTVELFVNHLIQIFDQCKRVLKKGGSCFVVISDTYSGSGTGQKSTGKHGYDPNMFQQETKPFDKSIPKTSMCMVPERFAIKMIEHGWLLRNKIIWKKPSAMPQSAKTRFTNDWEYVYFFTKNENYFFKTQYEPINEDSIKRELRGTSDTHKYAGLSNVLRKHPEKNFKYMSEDEKSNKLKNLPNWAKKGRIKRAVWTISSENFGEKHFATYPRELVLACLDAGCPDKICVQCNKPYVTIYDESRVNTRPGINVGNAKSGKEGDPNKDLHNSDLSKYRQQIIRSNFRLIKGCNCEENKYKRGIVLDPFLGAGTTALVALQNSRKFVGIELSDYYINMARNRIKEYI